MWFYQKVQPTPRPGSHWGDLRNVGRLLGQEALLVLEDEEGLAIKNSWHCSKQYRNTLAKKKAPYSLIPHLETSIPTRDLKVDIPVMCQHMKIPKHEYQATPYSSLAGPPSLQHPFRNLPESL